MSETTVIDIVVEYLKKNGFDGLCSVDAECGCSLDDLAVCSSEGILSCTPGYQVPCNCEEGHDYHIAIKKQQSSHSRESGNPFSL